MDDGWMWFGEMDRCGLENGWMWFGERMEVVCKWIVVVQRMEGWMDVVWRDGWMDRCGFGNGRMDVCLENGWVDVVRE